MKLIVGVKGVGPGRGSRRLALAMVGIASALTALVFSPAAREETTGCSPCLVTVNFAQAQDTHGSMLGFLRGMDESTPSAQLIAPLHPAIWRGGFGGTPYERAATFGARYELVLGDLWGNAFENWHGRGPPYADLSAWYTWVRNLALANRNRAVIWDIWNEPDLKSFWKGTPEQFDETFQTAEAAIRSVLGSGAVMAGPSVAWLDWPWMRGLLEYCAVQDCQVDALSWHETGPAQNVAKHLRRAQRLIQADPLLSGVPMPRLLIDEYLGGTTRYQPGTLVAYLEQLESGGADGAVLACWREPTGLSACAQQTLDGLIDPASGHPRGTWWAAKAYAQGVGSRVQSVTSSPAIVSLASARAPDVRHAEVLLGYFDAQTPQPESATVTVTLRNLGSLPFLHGAHTVRIWMERLVQGPAPSSPLPLGAVRALPVVNGVATITVPNVALGDALVLHLAPPRGS